MEAYYSYLFDRLNFEAENSQIFTIENSGEPVKPKRVQAELLFEHYGVGGLYFKSNAVLAAFLHSRENAVIVDVGGHNTFVTPIVEGFTNHKCELNRQPALRIWR